MIDLHSHLLPGIDDGARDLAEAVEMARLAAADGCEAICATPHQLHPFWTNDDRTVLERLVDEVREQVGDSPRILPGGEIHVTNDLLGRLDRLEDSGLLPLAGTRYLLLELDRQGLGPDPEETFHEVMVMGWRPILAHPELYRWLMERGDLVDRLAAMGVLFQVTAMSITGELGRRPEAASHALIDAGLVQFVASDAHGPVRRPPGLSRAARRIAQTWGEEAARRLTRDHPAAVLENRPLVADNGG